VYLRHHRRKKNGKVHTYWTLVRSVRKGSKIHQERVAYLGELDSERRHKARQLAQHISGRAHPGQLQFFEASLDQPVRVKPGRIRVKRKRQFGDVWLAWVLWGSLRFQMVLDHELSIGQEDTSWAKVITALVLARLCQPSSELRIAEGWYRKTALDDLLDLPEEKLNATRFSF